MYIAVHFHREIYVKWSDSSFTANPGLFSGGGAPLKNDVNDMRRKQILKPDNEEDLRLFTKNTQQT